MVRGQTRAESEAVEENGLNLKSLKEKKISELASLAASGGRASRRAKKARARISSQA